MYKQIKSLLKNLLPTPANSFHTRVDMLSGTLSTIHDEVQTINAGLQVISNRIGALEKDYRAMTDCKVVGDRFQEISTELKFVQNKLQLMETETSNIHSITQAIHSELPEKAISYNPMPERSFYKGIFDTPLADMPDFEGKFLRLIKGLDHDSIANVIKALKRQQILCNFNSKYVDVLTLEEQRNLRLLKDFLYSNTLKISDSLYAFNGYLLPQDKFEVVVFYYRYGLDLLKTLDLVGKRDIIDAGAFIGDSALIFSPLTSKNVHAFEAVPENFQKMLRTIELNNLENVVPENKALTCESTTVSISIPKRGSGNSCTGFEREGTQYSNTIEVTGISIDDYAEQHNLDIGLIKIDVEGAEQDVLKGAIRTIKAQRPILIISIYHNQYDFFNIKPMIEELNLGYKFRIYHPIIDNCSAIIESLLIAEVF